MNNPIELLVPLGEGESHTSFCSRLAFQNCCKSVFEFCNDWGISARGLVDGTRDALMALASLGCASFESLWVSAIRRTADGYVCGDEFIAKPMLRRMRTMVCPACIAEDMECAGDLGPAAAYGRTAWLLRPVHTCPKHNLTLVEVARGYDGSQNGLDIHDFTQRIGDVAGKLDGWMEAARPAVPTPLELYVHRRLQGDAPMKASWLNTLPFYWAVRACEVVGAVDIGGSRVVFSNLGDEQWCEAGAAGFDRLAEGPEGLQPLLDRLFSQPNAGKGDIGPRTFLGPLYSWLIDRDEPDFAPLRSMVRETTLNRMAMPPEETMFGRPLGERRMHSVHSASKAFAIHPKRLRKLLRLAGFLDETSASLTNDLAVFPADAKALDFLALVRDAMTLKEGGEYINAPRVQIHLLHDSGLIVPFIRGRTGDGIKDHAFDRCALDAFLGRLLADATDLLPGEDDLVDIRAAAKRAQCLAADVVRMLLDRNLARVRKRPGVTGYMSVLVDPVEVRANLGIAARPGLSLHEVHRRMGWSRPVVVALIDHGHLPAKVITNPVTGMQQRIVDETDLDRFAARYVSLFALAKERSAHHLKLKQELDGAGIQPAFDTAQVPASFYERDGLPSP